MIASLAVAGALAAAPISAGQQHGCAIRGTELWCWGGMTAAQAKAGTGSLRPKPERIEGAWRHVAAGGRGHTCAVDTDGGVWCWDLGAAPRRVEGAVGDEVTVGMAHACARAGERVSCWGSNSYGQLGDGASAPRAGVIPVAVDRVRAIDAGDMHTCALRLDGAVVCWGSNGQGQLGSGAAAAVGGPEPVAWIQDAAQVTAGGFFSCARRNDGTAVCWGDNLDGQLGDGSRASSRTPVAVTAVDGLVDLSAGFAHACGARSDGRLLCWGASEWGQIGSEDGADHLRPGGVPGVVDARRVSAGQTFTCVVRDLGIQCMGDNTASQLGDGGRVGGPALRAVRFPEAP